MPIVSHALQSTAQADGSTSNILRMYEQDAREYMVSFFAPSGFDVTGKVNLTIAEMNVQLAEAEFESIIGQAE